MIKSGIFLKSTSALRNTVFDDSKIVITELNANGAIGFIFNKPFGRTLNELDEFKNICSFPLNNGGPVDNKHLFFIHQRPDLIDNATRVGNGIYFGGDFKQAVNCINKGDLTEADIKIFVGYCGWDKGELEAEIEESSWVIIDGKTDILFTHS